MQLLFLQILVLIFDSNIKFDNEFIRGQRIKLWPTDDYCAINKEEFNRIKNIRCKFPRSKRSSSKVIKYN